MDVAKGVLEDRLARAFSVKEAFQVRHSSILVLLATTLYSCTFSCRGLVLGSSCSIETWQL